MPLLRSGLRLVGERYPRRAPEALGREALDREALDREALAREVLTREALDREALAREVLTREALAREVLARAGTLEVRLARSAWDVWRAQRLRFKVFHGGMAATPGATARMLRRDADRYDAVCDHLIAVDLAAPRRGPGRGTAERVVGTYRLLRGEVAGTRFGFYSAGEFDLGPLLRGRPGERLLELGRSCVHAAYRDRGTVDLLWRGLAAYVARHRIDALIGCASLPGTDPEALAEPLSYLHHHALAPAAWRPRALPGRAVRMDRVAPEALDARAALRRLPPLVKGYLRCGARFGEGAVIDRAFGTVDVFAVMPIAAISARYLDRYALGDAGARASA